jgi:hypothetical protein
LKNTQPVGGTAMFEQREQLRQRAEELVARFDEEIDRGEWVTARCPKRLRDDAGLVYEVPARYLQKVPTSPLLDPTVDLTGTNTSRRSAANSGPHGPPSTG